MERDEKVFAINDNVTKPGANICCKRWMCKDWYNKRFSFDRQQLTFELDNCPRTFDFGGSSNLLANRSSANN